MTLQQLRFLTAVFESDFNITAAAQKLRATQPAVSRQLLLLEQELGFNIFSRNGRALARVTPQGKRVIEHARRVLRETQNIKRVSAEFKNPSVGELRIATTPSEARYVLPGAIGEFRTQYPDVRLHLQLGTGEQLSELVRANQIDFAIATGARDAFSPLVLLPCYRWYWRLVVPGSHPLAGASKPTLEELTAYPILACAFGFSLPSIDGHVALTAPDAEVVKSYVRVGLGVGIVADFALDAQRDRDLVAIDAAHLFPPETTWVGFAREGMLRKYMYDFLALLAPHLSKELVDRAHESGTQAEVGALFPEVPPLPSQNVAITAP